MNEVFDMEIVCFWASIILGVGFMVWSLLWWMNRWNKSLERDYDE